MDRVVKLLDEGRYEEALQALLTAWREVRAPELEDAIGALSGWLAQRVPPVEPGDDAFYERASLGRAVDLPALLERLLDPPKGSLPSRVRALLVRPPDPRLGAALLPVIDSPPTTASSNFGMWTAIFDALPGLVDQRAADRLRARAAKHDGASQFWPKFTRWIEAAASELPPPAALDPVQGADLGALYRRLAAGPPSAGLAPEGRSPAEAIPPDATLAEALRAMQDQDLERALDVLVWAWGSCRAPAVGDAIERLGALVDAKRPALPVGAALQAAWIAAGDAPRPSAVGRLLEVWRSGTWPDVELRMAQMRTWSPDPRVSRAMLALTRDYMVGARRPMWSTAYDLLIHHADPRMGEAFFDLHQRLPGRRISQRRAAQGHASDRAIGAIREVLAQLDTLAPDEQAALEALTEVLSGLARPPAGADLERALIDAIVAAPDDDRPRLVYADWLREQGRERGEFIALDLALAAGQKVKSRRDRLLKDREAALGPMAVVLGRRTVIERGFVMHADLEIGKGVLEVAEDRRREILEDPGWRTVRSVHGWEGVWEALARSPLDSLRDVRGHATLEEALLLADRPSPLGVVSMHLGLGDEPDGLWIQLDDLVRVLPDLRHLDVMRWSRDGDRATPPARLFSSALVARLEVITCGGTHIGGRTDVGAWLRALIAAGSPVPRIELLGPDIEVALDRTDGGRYAVRVTATAKRPSQAEELASWFSSVLPAQVASVALVVDGDSGEPLRAALSERLGARG